MQTTGNFITLAAKFSAGMELGHNYFEGAYPLLRVNVYRDTTAVITPLNRVVGEQSNGDLVGVAGHGFVDGVVYNFPNKVVQAGGTGGSDVHAGAAANSLQALEHSNTFSAIAGFFLFLYLRGFWFGNFFRCFFGGFIFGHINKKAINQ